MATVQLTISDIGGGGENVSDHETGETSPPSCSKPGFRPDRPLCAHCGLPLPSRRAVYTNHAISADGAETGCARSVTPKLFAPIEGWRVKTPAMLSTKVARKHHGEGLRGDAVSWRTGRSPVEISCTESVAVVLAVRPCAWQRNPVAHSPAQPRTNRLRRPSSAPPAGPSMRPGRRARLDTPPPAQKPMPGADRLEQRRAPGANASG